MVERDSDDGRPQVWLISKDSGFAHLLAHILVTAGFAARMLRPEQVLRSAQVPAALGLDAPPHLASGRHDALCILDGIGRDPLPAQLFDLLTQLGRPCLGLLAVAPPPALRQKLIMRGWLLLPRMTPPELLIASLHSRIATAPPPRRRLCFEDLQLDTRSMQVHRAGRLLSLRPVEFRLLQRLLSEPDRVFTRRDLAAAIWGDHGRRGARTLDVHIARLRLAINAGQPRQLLRSLRGVGYALAPAEDAD